MTKPLLISKDRAGSTAQIMRSGLGIFVYVLLYGYAAFRAPQFIITSSFLLLFLLLYIQFFVRNRWIIWEFYDDYLIRKRPWGHKNTKILYNKISSWQVRERFGSASKREITPNYTETAFWTGPNTGFSFDEVDFSNYSQMHEIFYTKMAERNIEMAPYRE